MRKKEVIEDYGKEFITCDPLLDGKPLCRLGVPNGQYTCRTVQVHGAPALQVLDKYRSAVKVGKGYRIFVIGEAPGQYEDRLGIPFVGDAGDLLLQLLEEADLPLSDIFITNTARCRPPKNRNPAAVEINACLTHLYYEFRKHEPDIVILTGRVPLRVFNIRGGGIGNVRGEVFEKQLPLWPDGPTFKVIPTYHPAFLRRKKSAKLNSRVVSDLRIAKALYYGQDPNKKVYLVKYKVCETVQDVKDMVQEIVNHGSFAWDSESPNLRLQTSPVITVQLSIGKDKTWVIPFYHHDDTVKDEFQLRPHFNSAERFVISQELSLIFENENIVKLGQNVKYDMNVIKRWLGLETKGTVHDVALLHHLIDCYPPHGLKYLADLEFYVGNYAAEVEAIVGTGRELRETYDKVPDEVLWPYGATDAEMTYRLAELYLPQVQAKPQLWKLYLEESMPSIEPFQEAEWYGTKVDAANIEFAKNYYSSKLTEAELAARNLTTPDFNPHSHAQVQKELIKRGLSQQILAPATSAGYSTKKDILLQVDDDLARLVIKCRKYKKRMSTYVERILTDIEYDSRVRYGFNLTSTVSGRQSCRVYHQMPKLSDEKEAGTALRAIFAEDDDFEVVFGDFSQIEIRLFAYLTGEEELIYVLENGEDIHATTAAGALGIDVKHVSKFNRDSVGKCVDPSTLIIVDNKITAIKNVIPIDLKPDTFSASGSYQSIYTYSGNLAKITSTYNGGLKPMKVVTTRRGIIKCSNNHLFKKADGSLVKACELKFGDLLFEESKPSLQDIPRINNFSSLEHNVPGIPKTTILSNKDLAYLCGVVIGDGCVSSHSISISHGPVDKKDAYGNYYQDWQEILYQLFERVGFAPKKNRTNIYLGSRKVISYFNSLGIVSWKDKNNSSKNLEIPQWIIDSGLEGFFSFLGGLIDTDGYVGKTGLIDITSKSPTLIGQIAALSSFHGLDFSTQREWNKMYQKSYYTIVFTKECSNKIKSYIRHPGKLSRVNPPMKASKIPLPNSVLAIEDAGLGPCVDLALDSKDHLYWTNNLITHNTLNFGAIYGSQGHQIANCKFENPATGQIELVGANRAKQFLFMFKERFPKVKYFLETVPEEALANGCYVRSVFGRQRYLPDLTSDSQSAREAAEREATNFKIQSPAASINTRTIIAVREALKKYNIGPDKVRFAITVHDSIIWGVRKNLVSWFKQCFKTVAERPIPEIDGRKFPISIGVGKTWAEAELNSKEA